MKRISTLMIMLIFVAGCSSTTGGRNLTLTGGDSPSINCGQGASSFEIKPEVLPFLLAPKGALSDFPPESANPDDRVETALNFLHSVNFKRLANECRKFLD